MNKNTGQPEVMPTSRHDLQANHLGTRTKDLEAFWLLVFPLEKQNISPLGKKGILPEGQMLNGLRAARLHTRD